MWTLAAYFDAFGEARAAGSGVVLGPALCGRGRVAGEEQCRYCVSPSPYPPQLGGATPLTQLGGATGEEEYRYCDAPFSLTSVVETCIVTEPLFHCSELGLEAVNESTLHVPAHIFFGRERRGGNTLRRVSFSSQRCRFPLNKKGFMAWSSHWP